MRHTTDDFDESVRCRREFWKIVYVISGAGHKIINDRHYPLAAGSLFVIHPDDRTTYRIDSDAIEIYNILFMPELIADGICQLKSEYDFFSIFGEDFRDASHEYREMLYVLDSSREIEQLIRKMEKEDKRRASNHRNMIKLYLQALLITISRLSSRKASKGKKQNIARYIEHIVAEHYHEDFSLDKLAESIGFTKSHLCRIFKETTGDTIMNRLLQRRLDEAETMLRLSSLSISEVCFRCGFNNLSYFYRAFAARNGLNPGSFRKTFVLR
jgi:AraC-like DNA-binding protein